MFIKILMILLSQSTKEMKKKETFVSVSSSTAPELLLLLDKFHN